MSYQIVSTSDVHGDVDKDREALIDRVNYLVGLGYVPVGGPVVRNNPECGDYFLQAMFKPRPLVSAGGKIGVTGDKTYISQAIQRVWDEKHAPKETDED